MQGQTPTQFSELFVNPANGSDQADGSQAHPYPTITRALQRLSSEKTLGMTTLRLSPGTYSEASGERFPLVVPDRVSIAGEATGQGRTVMIVGGGEYHSPTFGPQSIAIRLGDTTLLNGVTITNPMPKGTGIWIESNATIANCSILNCGREGIFATDRSNLAIVDCLLQGNRASGISLVRHAKGQIRRSIHKGNSFGLIASDYAAPLVIDSQFVENRSGIVLSGTARPVLRNNRIERNHRDGLAIFNQASPDLGQPQDPAYNCFRENGDLDLRNTTAIEVASVANNLAPTQVQGLVTFVVSQIAGSNDSALQKQVKRYRNSISQLPSFPTPPKIKLKPVLPPPPPNLQPLAPGIQPDLSGHWAEHFVHGLLSNWAINPFLESPFQPDRPISRAEYATWLIKTFNLPTNRSPQSFSDVPSEYWANIAITQAQRMGFVAPFADGTFRPEENLTRLQAIVSLVNGLEMQDSHSDVLQGYRDRAQIPSWAAAAVASATQNRLIVSQFIDLQSPRLRPLESITRAEIAAMLYQALVWLGQSKPIASVHIVNPTVVSSFSDIQQHWAADFIRSLTNRGLMAGSAAGAFAPDRPMPRAEFAALLVNLFRPVPERPAKAFTDVPANVSAAEAMAIDQVYRSRLMGGFADDTFRPQQPITRIQVLLALVSGLKCPGADRSILDRFVDASAIPESARRAIAAATAQWLVVNFPNLTQLRPNAIATRAEVAAIVYQALVRLGQAPAIPSPYLIDPRHPNQHQAFRIAPIVVLDPGHGGADLGAVTGGQIVEPEVPSLLPVTPTPLLREKDIVLPIAHEIATLLQQHGIQALLTRSSDRYVTPDSRIHLAEQVAADLLISLHTNATTPPQPEVNGLETYYYAGSRESQTLAHTIHAAMLQLLNLNDRHVRSTYFYLLRSASIPAVHLEVGYITGNQDAPNLTDPHYRKQIAEAIINGILQYENLQLQKSSPTATEGRQMRLETQLGGI